MRKEAPHQSSTLLAKALELHRAGQLKAAQTLYAQVLELQPQHFDALHLAGVLAAQLRDFERAERLLSEAVKVNPNHPIALNNRGNVLKELGQLQAAVASYDRAITLKPDYAECHLNRAVAFQASGRLDDALAGYDKAIALDPGHAEAYNNRGTALAERGDLGAAVSSYERSLALRPDEAQVHFNRGIALGRLGRTEAALASHERAIALAPGYAEAHFGRGLALQELGQLDRSIASYDKAIALRPDFAAAYANRGAALQRLQGLEAAVASLDQAIALDPSDASVYYNRGVALHELGQLDSAVQSYRAALSLKPDFAMARWALAFVTLPPVFALGQDPGAARQAFARALDDLDQWFQPSRMEGAHEAVATRRPFYLSYQEADNRPLLSRYGALCCRLMHHWQQACAIRPEPPSSSGKIRVGIVSSNIRSHSVWTAIVRGIVVNLDPERFELHLFVLESFNDRETELARSKATSFTEGERSLARWAGAVARKGLDVLIYPEVGMHALTSQLASLRLAPAQVAMWGHPDTTGLPTIDYYISAAALEPDDAEAFYTESLIRLPNLGCHYARQPEAASPPQLTGLDPDCDRPLLLSPGTTFKYMPQNDWVYAEIARRLGNCRLVFFSQQPQWTSLLKDRLRAAFEAKGVDFDAHVSFVPWLQKAHFLGLMRRADIFLDTIGFSGFNTAMQAVECGLPIVTRQGRYMRGRLASAILTQMGMSEMVAATDDDYVRLAVRLAEDVQYRNRIRQEMLERQRALFGDLEPIRALERFLAEVCRPSLQDKAGGSNSGK